MSATVAEINLPPDRRPHLFVSAMSTVYNVCSSGDSEPDGKPVYTTLVAMSLMVFYIFALQCASTVAVVRRETNSWKRPLFQWLYMGALAWGLAFLTYEGG